MPLTTEGMIEELHRWRSDKLALVALLGSMGHESEADALARLRHVRDATSSWLTDYRRKPLAERRKEHAQQLLCEDVYALAGEVEPWLAQVVERATT